MEPMQYIFMRPENCRCAIYMYIFGRLVLVVLLFSSLLWSDKIMLYVCYMAMPDNAEPEKNVTAACLAGNGASCIFHYFSVSFLVPKSISERLMWAIEYVACHIVQSE